MSSLHFVLRLHETKSQCLSIVFVYDDVLLCTSLMLPVNTSELPDQLTTQFDIVQIVSPATHPRLDLCTQVVFVNEADNLKYPINMVRFVSRTLSHTDMGRV